MEVTLLFHEPQPVLDDIVGRDLHPPDQGGRQREAPLLADLGRLKAVDVTQKRFRGAKVPAAVKALTLYRLDGVIEILDSVKRADQEQGAEEGLRQADREGRGSSSRSSSSRDSGRGPSRRSSRSSRRRSSTSGREQFYRVALEDGFDYSETPDELEKKALAWIDEELPKYRDVVKRLAKHYRCEADPGGRREAARRQGRG